MALPAPDMEDCCQKKKCVAGVNKGKLYSTCDPCQDGGINNFDAELCDCFDASGTWRVVVTTYISPGGTRGYLDEGYLDEGGSAVCPTTMPGVVTGVYKSDPDSGPSAWPWVLYTGDYMYAYVDLSTALTPGDRSECYFVEVGTPSLNNNFGIKWNKSISYYRGTRTLNCGTGRAPLYVIARRPDGGPRCRQYNGNCSQFVETGVSP